MFRNTILAALRLAAAVLLFATAGVSAEAETPALRLDESAIATLKSIREIEANFYTVDCKVDYYLDELLEKGVKDSKTLEAFVSEKLMHGLPFNFETIHLGCSSFAAAMPNGDYIQGRNMDLSYAKNFMVHTKPKNGYESISMVSGHLLGYTDKYPADMLGRLWTLSVPYFPIDGVNEKGLSVALLMLADKVVRQDRGKPPITTTLAIRMMLDKAATVDEAITLMDRHDMQSIADASFHFHVVDAQGGSAVIEYVNDKMQVIRPTGYGQPVTNYYLTPGMYDVVIDGQDRMEILEKAMNEHKGVVTKDQAWKMLESVKAVHDYDKNTGIDFMTAYSMIYNNTKRTVDICIDAKFDRVYKFSLAEWRNSGDSIPISP